MDSNKRKRDQVVDAKDQTEIKRIKALEASIHANQKNLNNIAAILNTRSNSHHVNYTMMMSLYRIFAKLLDSDLVKSSKAKYDLDVLESVPAELDLKEKQTILHDWLSKTYRMYVKQLLKYLESSEVALQISALRVLMNLLQKEGSFLHRRSTVYNFPNILYYEIIEAVLNGEMVSDRTVSTLAKSYINQYSDLRYFAFKSIPKIVSSSSNVDKRDKQSKKLFKVTNLSNAISSSNIRAKVAERCFVLLKDAPIIQEQDTLLESFWVVLPQGFDRKADVFTVGPHRKYFEESWLSFMRLPLSDELYKQTLTMLHRSVMPGMLNPLTLMDFLARAYDSGGPISLLALNGLFTLITKYNLTYPEFYTKLYALFDCNLMHMKYRSRFFRLADTFLASTHLPSYLVAAFIKRMARLCLFGTPASVAVAIPFIYNLLKRHPSCMVLIHKVDGDDGLGRSIHEEALASDGVVSALGNEDQTAADNVNDADSTGNNRASVRPVVESRLETDPYNFDETDPAKCRAMESSLWEIRTMQNHYYTNISTLACMFNETFTKPEYVLEDFLDHTYSTMFATETKRKIKKAPALVATPPTTLLRNGEALSQILDFV